MAALWTCNDPTCGSVSPTKTETCPKCGGPTKRVGEGAWRGWVMIACGLVLAGMMVLIIAAIGTPLYEAARGEGSDSFTGTAEQAQAILYLFYTIIAFGLVAIANGTHTLITGAQNRIFMVLTFLLLLPLFFFIWMALKDME